MLISETHFTKKSYIKFNSYTVYHTIHPDGTAHGGSAIIIKNNIKHYVINEYQTEQIQATNVVVEDCNGPLTISAVYCPPKHATKQKEFEHYLKKLGNRFISGGDFNAKHPQWGSRLMTPKGRELYKAMGNLNLHSVSTGEPTYWPTDRRKIPDVIDFYITKSISKQYLKAKSCLDLSSDHSPVLLTLSSKVIEREKACVLCNKKTDWVCYKQQVEETLNMSLPLKTDNDITEAIEHFNQCIQQAAWNATPVKPTMKNVEVSSVSVRLKVAEKRQLRKQWQITRSPELKSKLNKAIKSLRKLLHTEANDNVQNYLRTLGPTQGTDYSIWKATKRLKQPQISFPPLRSSDGEWARSAEEKAEIFAQHLTEVFTPHPGEVQTEDEIHQVLNETYQMELPLKKIKMHEVIKIIKHDISPKKAPGYDLINGSILQNLPKKGWKFLTQLFNAVLRTSFFPLQWKVAQMILILKPGKNPEDVKSYRPISLLPIISKVFEKLILARLKSVIERKKLIPNHQFGFRHKHATIEQAHRVYNKIFASLEEKKYCSAAFLDITQAFDKVWHTGLLYKIKTKLPLGYYTLLKSYLQDRHFYVKYQDASTKLNKIQAGVPQGSVLGPILYLLYTADLPTKTGITTATFADDTAVLASHESPSLASQMLQNNLNEIQKWLQIWRIKANEAKSVHVTFTTRKETCPAVLFNGQRVPQPEVAKYLGMYFDRRLNWKTHIFTKRKQLGLKLRKLFWLLNRNSELTMENKLLLYKTILKPVWTYGIQLWGTAANSNIEILQRFQSKVLRMIADVPWFVPNDIIQRDLQVRTIKEEIQEYCKNYDDRLKKHPNILTANLMKSRKVRRLKRRIPSDFVR